MSTFLFAFGLMLLSIVGLALGVLSGRAPLKGSCGGVACHKAISCSGCRRGANP